MKVYIDSPLEIASVRVWIIDDSTKHRAILHYENGNWRRNEIKDGFMQEPSLILPGSIANEIMQAMANAFAEKGLKTDSDHKIQGTLEATKYHLEDLRKLLKLEKNKS